MKVSELLRTLADKLEHLESGDQPEQSGGQTQLTPVDVDNTDHTDDSVMLAPLQQKLELLKKSVGVPNAFDDEAGDELDQLKKNAGVPIAAVHIASDDEPLDM